MSKTFGPTFDIRMQMPVAGQESRSSSNEGFFNNNKGTLTRDNKGFLRDKRRESRDQQAADPAQSQRFSLFEQKMRQAENEHMPHPDDKNTESDEENWQVLFETGRAAIHDSKPSVSTQTSVSELQARTDRIFKEVSIRLDAAIRPGPTVISGPVTITIPMNLADSAMSRVEVTLADTLVTVKLCFSATAGPVDASQQLLAAASQLGHLLQAHLPDRRIKIVTTSPASDEDDVGEPSIGETLVAGASGHHVKRADNEV